MTIDGHNAVITYDPDIDMFRGEFVGLTGDADFYAKTPDELRHEGHVPTQLQPAIGTPYESLTGSGSCV